MGEIEQSQSSLSIVYFINALDTGGAEVGMCRLLDGLDASQYDVTVVSLNGCNPEFIKRIPDNVTVIDVKSDHIRTISTIISKIRTADIIVGSLYHSVLLSRIFGLINKSAITATWQHNEVFKTGLRKKVIGITNGLSDVVLADSEPVADMYCNEFGVDKEFVRTVPIAGVDLSKFSVQQHHKKETVTVGSVGRLVPQKNYETLIKIANELPTSNIKFQIAGDGPKRSELEKKIREKDLKNIEFIGEVANVPKFLSTVDIYVQPSRWEGLCMTVIEAMAAGLPIVASSVGGIKYNVTDGQNGYLHRPNDVSGFCNSIQELAVNPEMRQNFGTYSRNLVKNNYTEAILVESFIEAVTNKST